MMQENDKLSNFNILLQFPGTQERPENHPKAYVSSSRNRSKNRNCRITFDIA
ncbi:hypothetical protein SAMN04488122_5518 [Chitinophaga arvensicola]|uniref:Uncharacterized protein n=1 Tax=Chitinophaga arvensicola TaxID=29529 RepID=A0A1I0SAL0_9BACT|nr:hypothetical protein SAMN04488122_5518 [Chitinophaga arvensicola]